MSYRPLPEINESADELEQPLRAERDSSQKARFHLLLLLRRGTVRSQAEAAAHLALHRTASQHDQ